MLGYEQKDLNEMIKGQVDAMYVFETNSEAYRALEKTYDFLSGLWAEGYFD
jgi:hypothetical protein